MSSHPDYDRLLELLADRALFELSSEQQVELDTLLANSPDVDTEELDRVAATAYLATVTEQHELPAALATKIASDGRAMVGVQSDRTLPPAASSLTRREMAAWFTAAAALLVAAFFGTRATEQEVAEFIPEESNAAELKADLSRVKEGLTQVAWAPGTDEAGKQATGEVLWDNKRQQGVMSFKGLPVNDPQKSQYQLWIFDTAQDEKYPVDGGVFDIPAGEDEVLVPIHAKLPIVDPTLFAITIEKPGGVVVSSRERLPLLAQVDK
jgi:hypothetical protein